MPSNHDSEPNDIPHECPLTCPNRRLEGIEIFGRSVDPIEIVVHLAIALVILFPAARRSGREDFSPQEAMGWLGAIAAASALVRLAPTDRINAYVKLTGR